MADARRAGLARWHLEGASWRRVGPGIYAWAGLADTDALKLDAAKLNMPASAAFAGKTAAWLHGLDINPCEPIEVILPGHGEGWERGGVKVRRAELDRCEVVARRGFRTTSMMRTLSDLWWSLGLVEAVVVTDMALHAGLSNCAVLHKWVIAHAGRKGVRTARRVLALAEAGAESPMETRLRILLVTNGLPRPEVQVSICDEAGSFVGRPDLYYRQVQTRISQSDAGIAPNSNPHRTVRCGLRSRRGARVRITN